MSDSFINRLDESITVKQTDYVAFDVFDPNVGDFYTKKINFGTLSKTISGNVMTLVQSQIDALQVSVNDAKAIALQKLDRRGYELDRQIERMTGTLVLNNGFSALESSNFAKYLNVHNNGIYNLTDPISNLDAVNKQYVDTIKRGLSSAISAMSVQLTGFLYLSGGVMTGVLTTKGVDMSGYRITNLAPISTYSLSSDAVNRGYVDNFGYALSAAISAMSVQLTGYLMLSGGVMTGVLTTKGVDMSGYKITRLAAINATSLSSDAVNKGYVDAFGYALSSAISATNNALSAYLPLSGGVMTGSLTTRVVDMSGYRIIRLASTDGTSLSTDAVNKGYVDTRMPLSGGTFTGPITLKSYDETVGTFTLDTHAGMKYYNFDLNTGSVFEFNMVDKLSSFRVTNEPTNSYTITLVIKQNSTILYRLSSWKINMNPVKWAGFSPQITQSSNAIDIFAITKVGTNWFGFIGGQNYI